MTRIAVEEHFAIPEQVRIIQSLMDRTYPNASVIAKEKNIAAEVPFLAWAARDYWVRIMSDFEDRLKSMDENGIEMQVISPLIGPELLEPAEGTILARKINDALSLKVHEQPGRFQGLAALAPQDPAAAELELNRAVKELGLKGALINSNVRGEYLDNKKFRPILSAAAELDVPLYIHPRLPPPEMIKFYDGYPRLGGAMLGFSHEVSLHTMRLVLSGIFDIFPRLTVILGHLGEALPFWMKRIDHYFRPEPGQELKKMPSDYLRENFYVTTSGMYWGPALLCAHAALGADRILLGCDYPMEKIGDTVTFLESFPLPPADKEKIYHLNAEKVFKLG